MSMNLKVVRIKSKLEEMYNNKIDITDVVHIPQELRIRSRGTERHSASN